MKNIYLVILILFLANCASNDDFLDQEPEINSNIEITRIDELDKLFNGMGMPAIPNQVGLWCTDNSSMPQSILDESTTFSQTQIDQYLFNTKINRDSDRTWGPFFFYILRANLVLDYINSGELIESDEPGLKELLIAESHFYRAYYLFELAVIYNLYPSEANANELGMVLRKTSSLTENQSRATLRQTFDFILSELEMALKYPSDEKRSVYRINKATVNAVASRIHLYLGNYDKALEHANNALAGHSAMIDYATEVYELDYTFWYGDFVYPNTAEQVPFSGTSIADFYVDKYFYINYTNGNWNTSPSQELLDLYDDNDIRNLFFIEGWFTRYGATTNPWVHYMNSYVGYNPAGPGVPEMYLTRAECKARNNDISGAMADVEIVRSHRFHLDNYTALAIPSDAKGAVETIIEERRREDPYEYRFMDIKRLNNDPLTDPIILSRSANGETVTIQPDDRRYARPIGDEIVILSGGATQQNQY
ncbi:RagB/SusD family nutrient uptake outer membrane protein [Tamlana fucoidanivorans]|uniref:RagB/SusD family nutrient uptake outer membrane protein n=1 Tax=Allotamlana fucoidanivorans TaxID=2583814 RepID=A0A5C4ST68_9FLAO|nr:RagB/SusD family nutrient uptake outer membrane protein [Tamlana fucoidanivorans]TNJ46959.1 RagB/SusD family nutrient uptake outer membrane protein [Tamlana fucoidanivorans]